MRNKAAIPNPYLKPLEALVGEWRTVGSHPFFAGTELHGRTVFELIDGGAFLKQTSSIDHPDFPEGIAIIGSDKELGQMFMLYFDERCVSRKYDFKIDGNEWKWWRDDPKFSQRYAVKIEEGGDTMTSRGEMRESGGDWGRRPPAHVSQSEVTSILTAIRASCVCFVKNDSGCHRKI